jgi:adenylosuccinate synthase
VVRFQGGNNAGHTIINDFGKFALHLIPSGVFYEDVVNILGPGVALDVEAFLSEREELLERGVPEPTIYISDRAQVVLPLHILLDVYEEQRLGKKSFGSTRSGIAPFYADKYMKVGIQTSDLYDRSRLIDRLTASLAKKNVLLEHLYDKPAVRAEELADDLLAKGEQLKPYLRDTVALLHAGIAEGKTVLLEGQLGALRDPDHGIYPYPTSSSPLAGFGCVGAGVPPYSIDRIVAVTKSYSSCVGAGPFVSEIEGAEGDELRERGGDSGEYGATTGRPRRMGWFDLVATKYGCRIQGATEMAVTLLDVLGYRDDIPVCSAYEIDGKQTDKFPVPAGLDKARPVLEVLPGWKKDITSVRNVEDLPDQALNYVKYIQEGVGIPVRWISVGPTREAMIHVRSERGV